MSRAMFAAGTPQCRSRSYFVPANSHIRSIIGVSNRNTLNFLVGSDVYPRLRVRSSYTLENNASVKPQKFHASQLAQQEVIHPTPFTPLRLDDEETALVNQIKRTLTNLTTGEISPSAYDTAWVARIASPSSDSTPEFPQALDWIISNQYADGSWGDKDFFQLYDRVLSTLACLVTLKIWNADEASINKGVEFLRKNMMDLKEDDGDLLSGFEVTFPAMIEEARAQKLDIPYDLPYLKVIQNEAKKKLKKIPVEVLHKVPTTLLYSLEGLQGHVDWNRILSLQSVDGSFLSSPSSTACVYLHTKDQKCLEYLRNAMKDQNYAVPCHYPIDLFERVWVVDTLERLGIDGFFQEEIKEILDYVYKHWSSKGIGWGATCLVEDVDDTAMAFRILRLHGYDVSADVLKNFKAGDKFFCFPGELGHGVTEMLNLHRASQVAFPDEDILTEARNYSFKYLSNATPEQLDKWANKKDLMGEIKFELENTWWTTLPRMYANAYIEQYGENDLWIAKTIYRLYAVNNESMLKLARKYHKRLHSYHAYEIRECVNWWDEKKLNDIPSTRFQRNKDMIPFIYWVISSCMYQERFQRLRMFFVKSCCLNTLFDDLMDSATEVAEVKSLLTCVRNWGDKSAIANLPTKYKIPYTTLVATLEEMAIEAAPYHVHLTKESIHKFLIKCYSHLMESEIQDAIWKMEEHVPTFEDYMLVAKISISAWCHVLVTMFFAGEQLTQEMLDTIYDMDCVQLSQVVSRLCNDIATYEVELRLGQVTTGVACYMQDNPGTSQEEAVEHLKNMLDESWKKMTKEYLKPSHKLPKMVNHFNFEMVRMMLLTYTRQRDIFREPTDELLAMFDNMLKASMN